MSRRRRSHGIETTPAWTPVLREDFGRAPGTGHHRRPGGDEQQVTTSSQDRSAPRDDLLDGGRLESDRPRNEVELILRRDGLDIQLGCPMNLLDQQRGEDRAVHAPCEM